MKKKPKGSAAPEPKLLHDEACSVKEAIDMFAIIAGQFSDPIKKPETKQREIMQQLAAALL